PLSPALLSVSGETPVHGPGWVSRQPQTCAGDCRPEVVPPGRGERHCAELLARHPMRQSRPPQTAPAFQPTKSAGTDSSCVSEPPPRLRESRERHALAHHNEGMDVALPQTALPPFCELHRSLPREWLRPALPG